MTFSHKSNLFSSRGRFFEIFENFLSFLKNWAEGCENFLKKFSKNFKFPTVDSEAGRLGKPSP